MGEYASLTVWKNLNKETGSIFHKVYQLLQQGKTADEAYKELRVDYWGFGHIEFAELNGVPHYSYRPMDFVKREIHMKECKYNIPNEWLMCFSYSEFNVEGDSSFGKFTASTTVQNALERLEGIDFHKKYAQRTQIFKSDMKDLKLFLSKHSPTDVIMASSDLIYYSPDGEFGIDSVKEDINKKVKDIKEVVIAPHWRKSA